MARLCFVSCRNFHTEVAAAIAAEGWDDVVAAAVPARCGRPPLNWAELAAVLPPDCSQVVLLGRACLGGLGPAPTGQPPVRKWVLEQCFHLVAGPQLVAEAIDGASHLVTPGWLADWRTRLGDMGLAAGPGRPAVAGAGGVDAAAFFADYAREIVLLDTGTDASAQAGTRGELADFAATVQLPTRRIPVGLDTTRQLLARLVLEWRLASAQSTARDQAQRHAGEQADQVCMMELLGRLAHVRQEADAIATIEELVGLLFAPQAVHYLRVENEVCVPVGPVDEEWLASLRDLQQDYAWTPDGQGFMLCIGRGDKVVGKLAVQRLAFPAQRERYVNLALAMMGVCALAIENSRIHHKLVESEKMASLSILVAGVAHEINTPLGVNLVAASTLQASSRQLAVRFSEHSMTQLDLERYLTLAEAETTLICSNLERIAKLVDTFRGVAIEGKAPSTTRLRLRDCLEEVLGSLGEQFPRERVELRIEVEPTLEIEGLAADWSSIFGNLISNSLKHGLAEIRGDKMVIDIAATADAKRLRIDYRDDGRGMSAAALAKVFDPFFTTNPGQGMGLGMHLVYNLVNLRLHGVIRCDSQPGQGVHFRIEVPQ